jgi:hypothetical protein
MAQHPQHNDARSGQLAVEQLGHVGFVIDGQQVDAQRFGEVGGQLLHAAVQRQQVSFGVGEKGDAFGGDGCGQASRAGRFGSGPAIKLEDVLSQFGGRG